MEAHRIAVISDTHGLLRQEVIDVLKTCEVILHAGDIGDPDMMSRLEEIAPVFAVRGNVDRDWPDSVQEPPVKQELALFGYKICMVHNIKDVPLELSGIDIVVYGHSHRAIEKRLTEQDDTEILYLNPGSCGPRRFLQPVTMMVLTLHEEVRKMETELIDCLPGAVRESEKSVISDQDMHRLIRRIMKEVDAGRSVAYIAARNHMDRELAEQICRMYLTHPGVDVDGVMDRIKIKK